jgi:hypothetical protein
VRTRCVRVIGCWSVNDAPVLAVADVGVAMGARGSTAASWSADVVVMTDDLIKAAEAVRIGRRTMRVALESIWISIGLSIGLMVVAAFGYIPAIIGAVTQELVDLATIGNSLRVRWPGRQSSRAPSDGAAARMVPSSRTFSGHREPTAHCPTLRLRSPRYPGRTTDLGSGRRRQVRGRSRTPAA